ncbi:MAG: acyl-CoA dehydrogenase family protein [Proteobacteria bacterium]|nr:acyl-CoA dehydrogenase family protein [Pseudomonadota bacterium]MDA0993814.1 acyl-CoA dehydrogenase family protein [Pseudomonadota bacterium]
MDFSFSEEQTMLADSVARFIDTDYDFESRQKTAASESGYSEKMWRTFAELGWTAVPFAEEDGGLGGGTIEQMLVMEQIGRGLVVEPYLATVIMAGGILRRLASNEQKLKWLAPIIGGELIATLAFAEPQSRFNVANIATTAKRDGQGFVLNGQKTIVLNGNSADLIVVPARTSGNQSDRSGITLFAVPGDVSGLNRRGYATVDGLRAADIHLDNVRLDAADVLGEEHNGFMALDRVIGEATLAISAEAMGIMQKMHDKTVEYSKSRVQFGVPIGSFQALQHRMVDSLMSCEQSRSLLYWCVMLNAKGHADAIKAISALKYQVGTAGVRVAQEAVQIHGGMGVTWELDIAHYFKRITAIDLMFGNADHHLDRFISFSQ